MEWEENEWRRKYNDISDTSDCENGIMLIKWDSIDEYYVWFREEEYGVGMSLNSEGNRVEVYV